MNIRIPLARGIQLNQALIQFNISMETNLKNSSNSDSPKEIPSFLSDSGVVILQKLKETPSKIDRNLLLDYVRATAPTSIYKIAKETELAYTSIKNVMREFEFVGLIEYHVKIGKNNVAFKEINVKEKVE